MRRIAIKTQDGVFIAEFSERGLARLEFPASRKKSADESDGALTRPLRQWHTRTVRALESILAGRSPEVLPPLDWAGATPFQQRVWKALLGIARGQVKTYAEVAAAAGKPSAARAAGAACGANPIPVLVPCHRVVAANGKLGGFSAGLEWKRRLLAREGVRPEKIFKVKSSKLKRSSKLETLKSFGETTALSFEF